MKPLLSKRLLAHLDNLHDCFHDWARYQPRLSTDKPPGVDCCVFNSSADWVPTSFSLQTATPQPDGRQRVAIEYRFDSPQEHARWHVAVWIAREDGRFVVDDFEGGLDDPESQHSFLWAANDHNCSGGKWVTRY